MGDFLKVMHNVKKNTRAGVYYNQCFRKDFDKLLKLFIEIDLLKWNLFKFHG